MTSDGQGMAARKFQPLREVPQETVPLMFGPDSVTKGYYELESLERQAALEALVKHQDAVGLWYRALTLYHRGMLTPWDFTNLADDHTWLRVRSLQSQLLGLGLSTTKAALDMLLIGYYSVAYSSIRHMIETFVIAFYVTIRPMDAQRWFEQPDDPRRSRTKTPYVSHMIKTIQGSGDHVPQHLRDHMDKAYEAWDNMNVGSHPTGEGLFQVAREGADEGQRFVVGPTYKQEMCLIGFDHGLYALDKLLVALSLVKDHEQAWTADLARLRQDIRTWMVQRSENYQDSIIT